MDVIEKINKILAASSSCILFYCFPFIVESSFYLLLGNVAS